MTGAGLHPQRFFDTYHRFVETSATGPRLDRLNSRYEVLIAGNRSLLEGARVLDLACHDGRFTFAALMNGAAHVVGIDHKADLVAAGREHLDHYGVDPERYELRVGDLFDSIDDDETFDVVLCFGILYHLLDHHRLLRAMADVEPAAIVVDTRVSTLDGVVIELRAPNTAGPPPPGSQLEGQPTATALDALISSFGWHHRYLDWDEGDRAALKGVGDYRKGQRVSVVVTCPEHDVPPEVRHEAVDAVLANRVDLDTEYLTITMVAERFGIAPQALHTWVKRADRARPGGQTRSR